MKNSFEHTDDPTARALSRRTVLQGLLATGGATVALPSLFADQAAAAIAQATSGPIVVTITLAGGNDGLNTVGPFSNGTYKSLRGSLAIDPSSGHSVGNGFAMHPSLRRVATRYRRGEVAVVHGVGDPALDRSHFSSMARWQTGRTDGTIRGDGWLGRWLDSAGAGQFGGIAIGGQGVPLHLRGVHSEITDVPRNGDALFGSEISERRDQLMYRAIRRMGRGSDSGEWATRVGEINAQSVDAARSVAGAFKTRINDSERLSIDLRLAARLLNLGLGTRVLNVRQGGYDTHASQIGTSSTSGEHSDLLSELDAAIDVFFSEVSPTLASRVVMVVYSEFGRRAAANDSRGTDHGTSSVALVIGSGVRGGHYGDPPPLNRLDDRGDFRVTTDFRRLYASVLEHIEGDASSILGGTAQVLPSLFSPVVAEAVSERDTQGRIDVIRNRRNVDPQDYLRHHTPTF